MIAVNGWLAREGFRAAGVAVRVRAAGRRGEWAWENRLPAPVWGACEHAGRGPITTARALYRRDEKHAGPAVSPAESHGGLEGNLRDRPRAGSEEDRESPARAGSTDRTGARRQKSQETPQKTWKPEWGSPDGPLAFFRVPFRGGAAGSGGDSQPVSFYRRARRNQRSLDGWEDFRNGRLVGWIGGGGLPPRTKKGSAPAGLQYGTVHLWNRSESDRPSDDAGVASFPTGGA